MEGLPVCVCVCSPIKNLCLSLGSVQGSVCDQHNWLLGKFFFKKKKENKGGKRETGEALEIRTEKKSA